MEEQSLEVLMSSKSNEELEVYLTDIKKYSSQEISAALDELQSRGKDFTDLQLQYINNVINRKIDEEDPDIPTYYSKKAIWSFSILFSVVFGAVLLSSNLKSKNEKWIVIGFGILYTFFTLSIISKLNHPNLLITLGLNSIGSGILQTIFWNRYIGKDVKHKNKEIWKPLIISILITIPFVLISIFFPEI